MTAEKASTAMAARVSRVLLESSQMRTGVRVLRALLAGLESEVVAKHAPPVSSRTVQRLHAKRALRVRRGMVVHAWHVHKDRSLSLIALDASRAPLSAARTCLWQETRACSVVQASSRMVP
jgi:hypothetical protein